MFSLTASAQVKSNTVLVTGFDNELFTLDFLETETAIQATLTAKQDLMMSTFALDRKQAFSKKDIFFANGYQSWSTSVERQKQDTSDSYLKLADHIKLGQYLATSNSDYMFTTYGEKGVFHSETFT